MLQTGRRKSGGAPETEKRVVSASGALIGRKREEGVSNGKQRIVSLIGIFGGGDGTRGSSASASAEPVVKELECDANGLGPSLSLHQEPTVVAPIPVLPKTPETPPDVTFTTTTEDITTDTDSIPRSRSSSANTFVIKTDEDELVDDRPREPPFTHSPEPLIPEETNGSLAVASVADSPDLAGSLVDQVFAERHAAALAAAGFKMFSVDSSQDVGLKEGEARSQQLGAAEPKMEDPSVEVASPNNPVKKLSSLSRRPHVQFTNSPRARRSSSPTKLMSYASGAAQQQDSRQIPDRTAPPTLPPDSTSATPPTQTITPEAENKTATPRSPEPHVTPPTSPSRRESLKSSFSTTLFMPASNLQHIPPLHPARWSALTQLHLHSNSLTTFPGTTMRLMPKLQVLNLSSNLLEVLPPEIRYLTELKELRVAANCLSSLPVELGALGGLRVVDVSGNKIFAIAPTMFAHMTSLRTLNLSSNRLRMLPSSLGLLSRSLTELIIHDNPFDAMLMRLVTPYVTAIGKAHGPPPESQTPAPSELNTPSSRSIFGSVPMVMGFKRRASGATTTSTTSTTTLASASLLSSGTVAPPTVSPKEEPMTIMGPPAPVPMVRWDDESNVATGVATVRVVHRPAAGGGSASGAGSNGGGGASAGAGVGAGGPVQGMMLPSFDSGIGLFDNVPSGPGGMAGGKKKDKRSSWQSDSSRNSGTVVYFQDDTSTHLSFGGMRPTRIPSSPDAAFESFRRPSLPELRERISGKESSSSLSSLSSKGAGLQLQVSHSTPSTPVKSGTRGGPWHNSPSSRLYSPVVQIHLYRLLAYLRDTFDIDPQVKHSLLHLDHHHHMASPAIAPASVVTSPSPPQQASSRSSPPPPTVTHAPPAAKKKYSPERRQNVVAEIVATERTYVQQLETLVDLYVNPLEQGDFLNAQDCNILFANVRSVLMFHKDHLLPKLEEMIKLPTQPVGSVFLALSVFLKMYSMYYNNFDSANNFAVLMEHLANPQSGSRPVSMMTASSVSSLSGSGPGGSGSGSTGSDSGICGPPGSSIGPNISNSTKKTIAKKFRNFVRTAKTNPLHTQISLQAFLILPVQRLPRYRLLIDQVLECTPPEHEDYADLVKAAEDVRRRVEECNEKKREWEEREKGFGVLQRIKVRGGLSAGGEKMRVVTQGRRFVKEGTLCVVKCVEGIARSGGDGGFGGGGMEVMGGDRCAGGSMGGSRNDVDGSLSDDSLGGNRIDAVWAMNGKKEKIRQAVVGPVVETRFGAKDEWMATDLSIGGGWNDGESENVAIGPTNVYGLKGAKGRNFTFFVFSDIVCWCKVKSDNDGEYELIRAFDMTGGNSATVQALWLRSQQQQQQIDGISNTIDGGSEAGLMTADPFGGAFGGPMMVAEISHVEKSHINRNASPTRGGGGGNDARMGARREAVVRFGDTSCVLYIRGPFEELVEWVACFNGLAAEIRGQ
ncbi:hypothetical protein HK102_013456 [Quaeritorhiza haematococci]|nr:hypothetical protein HK102_013456 [Quaeritorhiza haematococci]